jgi:translation initiation factor 2 alpha subunit (eIF-2alpha)
MSYYFRHKIPNINDIVKVNVLKIKDLEVEVELLEFNNIIGYIDNTQLSKQKKLQPSQIVSLNKEYLAKVINIDNHNNINLSKKFVDPDDIDQYNNDMKIYNKIFSIFRELFMKIYNITDFNLIDNNLLYEFNNNSLFNLLDNFQYSEIYDCLTNINNYKSFFTYFNLDDDIINSFDTHLNTYISQKILTSLPSNSKSFSLECFNIDAIDDIKDVLDYEKFIYVINNNLLKTFDIKIIYIESGNYNLSLKSISDLNINQNIITNHINNIFDEIKQKCILKNIIIL